MQPFRRYSPSLPRPYNLGPDLDDDFIAANSEITLRQAGTLVTTCLQNVSSQLYLTVTNLRPNTPYTWTITATYLNSPRGLEHVLARGHFTTDPSGSWQGQGWLQPLGLPTTNDLYLILQLVGPGNPPNQSYTIC